MSCDHITACSAGIDVAPDDVGVGHPAGESLAGSVAAPGIALVEAEEAETLVAVDEVAEDLSVDPDGGIFVADFKVVVLGNVCGEAEDAVDAVAEIGHPDARRLEEEVEEGRGK